MGIKFNPVSIIRKKRNGGTLSGEEIRRLIQAYTADEIPDYQMSAFLMAAFIRGLNPEESAVLTEAMLRSGTVLDLDDIPGSKVDKHSTGGVGDKVSLVLAPIVASRGVNVPMISGRGLGHTGGTLDKLESITGFDVNVPPDRFRELLREHRMVMCGQTEEIAPADKRLYALRDVTATVESIPLIAGSIMSKKLAEGIDALVLDVKTGSGAFLPDPGQAEELARTMVSIGRRFGVETVAWMTSMEQPLGRRIGNWLEVEESIACLQGGGPDDVMEVTHTLAGSMLHLGGAAGSEEEGRAMSREAVVSGEAWETFLRLVEAQGGDVGLLRHPDRYPPAEHAFSVEAEEEGWLERLDAYALGMASLELGAGRRRKEDGVDPVAGIVLEKKIGDTVKKDETILRAFTNNNHAIEEVNAMLRDAFSVGQTPPDPPRLISGKVDERGILESAGKSDK
ncbi:MAG: thymidine phosphorylase [Balneolaceae bacterium]|nr:thymidine phosphorylase [Balneolaceae bacterium]